MFDRAAKPPTQLLNDHLSEFAQEGLRTLVIGCKELDEKEYSQWQREYDAASAQVSGRKAALSRVAELVEQNLQILGATAVEDKLQDGVPDTISDLALAGIKLWVLTGDKLETAINIGFSCKLLRPSGMTILRIQESNATTLANILQEHSSRSYGTDDIALVVTGKALETILRSKDLTQSLLDFTSHCSVVVACRVWGVDEDHQSTRWRCWQMVSGKWCGVAPSRAARSVV